MPTLSAGEEDKGTRDARRQERASTDVIVADQTVHAFGYEFETGYVNDAFIRSAYNPVLTNFLLEGFTGRINRIVGTLEATQLNYKKNGWLYLQTDYALNCRKMERKF